MMEDDLQEALDDLGADDWEAGEFGDQITCPHGITIQLDETCPKGCVSPLLTAGLI